METSIDTNLIIISILKIYLTDLFTQIPKIYAQDVYCSVVCNGKNWKESKCPPIRDWINKLWKVHATDKWNKINCLH